MLTRDCFSASGTNAATVVKQQLRVLWWPRHPDCYVRPWLGTLLGGQRKLGRMGRSQKGG